MGILAALVRSEEGALQVAVSAPAAVKLWEGILQLLRRKMEMERRYIERLEGARHVSGTVWVPALPCAATLLHCLAWMRARRDDSGLEQACICCAWDLQDVVNKYKLTRASPGLTSHPPPVGASGWAAVRRQEGQ